MGDERNDTAAIKCAAMPTPYESARLILKIFEMRREPVLREARNWFLRDFNPDTIEDVKAALAGPTNPWVRMVTDYWDMACSLVTHDAIDRQMFLDANTELFATFSKKFSIFCRRSVRSPPVRASPSTWKRW